MEHRLSERMSGRLALLVYRRGLPVASGQVRNASRNGLFIATDYRDIDLNQSLEVEFYGMSGFRRLKGHVVRKSRFGLGIELTGSDSNSSDVIDTLIEGLQQGGALVHPFPQAPLEGIQYVI